MTNGTRGSRPQRRGMIAAVCFCCVVVAAASWLLQHNQGVRSLLGGVSGGPVQAQAGGPSVGDVFAQLLAGAKASGPKAGLARDGRAELAVETSLSAADRRTTQLADQGAAVGHPRLLSGNAMEINGQTFVLWGIAVPQMNYSCRTGQVSWFCGNESARMLREYVGNQLVGCLPRGQDLDGRVVAICYIGTADVGGWLVEQGWAVADKAVTGNYNVVQMRAKRSQRGIWNSDFDPGTFIGAR